MIKRPAFFLVLLVCLPFPALADWPTEYCRNYIDQTLTFNRHNYLFGQTLNRYFLTSQGNALILGSGAGNDDITLVSKGWDVTSVDLCARTGEVLAARSQGLKGGNQFIQGSFENADFSGNYQLVMSYYALPFGNKNNLESVIAAVAKSSDVGAILSVNFFGYEHSYVKQQVAYGVSLDEITALLNRYHFNIEFHLNRIYDQPDASGENTHWDMIDIIAKKVA
ncbi:hypothetical protein [Legionella sp. W05-934-2]|uniref:hypothetical protein n=1 Tax=Legionella sp. W05-934-2 TaxID=1198649 RepID=UPI003462BCFC